MNEWEIIWQARSTFLTGFLNTLEMFALSTLLGLLFGILLLYLLEGPDNLLRRSIRLLIDAMRTVPFLILVYLLYYGLPGLGFRLSADHAGLLALTLYHGAYFAEILRSQRLIMPAGYIEAAQAHGFRHFTLYRRIILPSVLMSALPLLGNQLIICLKDTAFLSIITVQEITAAANSVQATWFIPFNAFIVAIALYWAISILLELLIKRLSALGAKRGMSHA